MSFTTEQITHIPITNLRIELNDWIDSVFGSRARYSEGKLNNSLLGRFISLFHSKVELNFDGDIYPLDFPFLSLSKFELGPSLRIPRYFYLRPGDKATFSINGIDGNDTIEAISEMLVGTDFYETWIKWFTRTRNPDETVISKRINIMNRLGLHARASAFTVKTSLKFNSEIYFLRKDSSEPVARAKSAMDLMYIAAARGTSIEIAASGPDAKHAVEVLSTLVSDGFGED
jgi:phosphocarrier protein HPr